jgi:ABC-type multidrug transport system fused ATPase/permease subunit
LAAPVPAPGGQPADRVQRGLHRRPPPVRRARRRPGHRRSRRRQGPAGRRGTIALDQVSFSYGAEIPALSEVSIQARKGETVALVGPSGGGKSSILNLIPRFYDVTAGAVTIDGHDVRAVTLASLRDRIALVTQEPFLFDDTIRANIAYARPAPAEAQIEAAARQAAAHDFILALPEGYDTLVGEAGARLSGGQRQRIAIARAFLKDAPILLLDEATSALDTESEAQVQAALERLMAGRTTILIAHRLSTVKNADRIYVIDKGRVVETGTHAELVRPRASMPAWPRPRTWITKTTRRPHPLEAAAFAAGDLAPVVDLRRLFPCFPHPAHDRRGPGDRRSRLGARPRGRGPARSCASGTARIPMSPLTWPQDPSARTCAP